MKSWLRYRGLLVIVFYQAVPIGVDSEGRTRIGFGVGGGQLEYATFNCDGSLYDADAVGFRTVAADLEHRSGKMRVTLAGGLQWADRNETRGPFAQSLLAFEGTHFGIGGGVGSVPIEGGSLAPSVYLRLGRSEKVHVRSDILPPAAHAPVQILRTVIAYNQFDLNRPAGDIGIALLENYGAAALVGSYFHPVKPGVAAGVRGFVAGGHRYGQGGLTAEVKVRM